MSTTDPPRRRTHRLLGGTDAALIALSGMLSTLGGPAATATVLGA